MLPYGASGRVSSHLLVPVFSVISTPGPHLSGAKSPRSSTLVMPALIVLSSAKGVAPQRQYSLLHVMPMGRSSPALARHALPPPAPMLEPPAPMPVPPAPMPEP